jgi:hypothetical protein
MLAYRIIRAWIRPLHPVIHCRSIMHLLMPVIYTSSYLPFLMFQSTLLLNMSHGGNFNMYKSNDIYPHEKLTSRTTVYFYLVLCFKIG